MTTEPPKPLRCFTITQWVQWHAAKIRPNAIDYACVDCSPEFKARMEAKGKCDYPCVKFFMMTDGTMEGRRMSIPGPRPDDARNPPLEEI